MSPTAGSPWPIHQPVGRSLAVDFANTTFYANGATDDDLATLSGLSAWFAAAGLAQPKSAVTRGLQREALDLRVAVRAGLTAAVAGDPFPPSVLRALNDASRQSPRWVECTSAGGRLDIVTRTADRRPHPLAIIAEDTMRVLAGHDREHVRHCRNERCIGFFFQTDPRQHFCSSRCATRSRVSRHYRQRHQTESDSAG